MATARFRLVSVALYTSPIPPTPISAAISYGPRRVPGVRAKLVDYTGANGVRKRITLAGALGYAQAVGKYRFTDYFENEVLRKRPYLKKEWCIRAIEQPIRVEPQEQNRFRFWVEVPKMEGRYLRVITLADRMTIHNAFLDRGFRP